MHHVEWSFFVCTIVGDDGLVGLGVVGYDQLEFEAIIMKDLDSKIEKESKDQQRKFAKNGLREITDEIKQSTIQLSVISKQITSLLVRPFTSVVTELKIQRTLQKNKVCMWHTHIPHPLISHFNGVVIVVIVFPIKLENASSWIGKKKTLSSRLSSKGYVRTEGRGQSYN